MKAIARDLKRAAKSARWSGDGPIATECTDIIKRALKVRHAFLTPSCTSALELACILANIGPGDEVIMPSFGFSSAANAVVLRGGVPVFVDIREDTLNIDPAEIAKAITPQTKAIMVVHYAGMCCEMDVIKAVAGNGIPIIEDAAQAYLSFYNGHAAGTLGTMAAFSFHDTKNIRCGEGGAFVTNDDAIAERAEIVREKGTNRRAFMRGQTDKYTWVDIGLSALPSEFQAAVLVSQLYAAAAITDLRTDLWRRYHKNLVVADIQERLSRPYIPNGCGHNSHIYRVMLRTNAERDRVLAILRRQGIGASFHFVPLHSSPAGLRYGRTNGPLPVTDDAAGRLLRMPLAWNTTEKDVDRACEALLKAI